MSHQPSLPQGVYTGKQLLGGVPLAQSRISTLQWLLQQQESEKQSRQPPSPGIMVHSPYSSSPDDILAPEYNFVSESVDDRESWTTMTASMYPRGPQIHFNAPIPQHSRFSPSSVYADDWNHYQSYGSPNENSNSSNFIMMNNISYSPNGGNNSLSPFSMPPRTPLSVPQLSPASSNCSLSPSYVTSSLSTPTTPASTTQSFLPSPTLSRVDDVYKQDSQVVTLDPDRPRYTHRQQLQMFREVVSLPREGAGPFIPQSMYKPHTTSDRKRYVEEVELEAPIYFVVEHSNQCGISLQDALHSRVKNLVNRERVVFEGRGPSVSIRLEWPGYRQWSRQIPTKDFRSPPGPITIAKLAKNVAKCVQRFMLDRKMLAMEDGSDEKWRIGDRPNDIKLEDLMLVSIHHVSLGSWQPHLRLRRPPSGIPIRSSPIRNSAANDILFSDSNLGWAS